MPGFRRPGPLGFPDETPTAHPSGIAPGGGYSMPVSVMDFVDRSGGASSPSPSASVKLLAKGLTFRFGATTYRVLSPGSQPAADEELLDQRQAREVLERAAQRDQFLGFGGGAGEAARLLAGLRGARDLVVVRSRSRVPTASTRSSAPDPAPPPPARKPKAVKEGWIEIEVVDEAGEPREGDAYRLKLPDGRVLEGTIGSKGLIAVHGIDPGNAELTITSLDAGAWSA